MNIKQYAVLIAGALITYIYSLFKNRDQRLAELQQQAATTKVTTELNALKKESENATKMSQDASNDYNALKLINSDLAAKLGISRRSDSSND